MEKTKRDVLKRYIEYAIREAQFDCRKTESSAEKATERIIKLIEK